MSARAVRLRKVATVLVRICTPDEELNDRMDAALCKALDACMAEDEVYDITINWWPDLTPPDDDEIDADFEEATP